MEPEMRPTPESSNVEEIGYDEEAEEVYVRFRGAGLYVYSNVPRVVYEDFVASPSKGGFVNVTLKYSYPYRRL